MAIVKESRISSRIATAIAEINRKLTGDKHLNSAFFASEIMGCMRYGVLRRRDGVAQSRDASRSTDVRYALHRMDFINVVKEDVSVSSQEMNLLCQVDVVAEYMDEIVLVNIRENDACMDKPLAADVYDMVSSMYVLGVWSGLLVYSHNDGQSVFFVNPDKRDACNIIADICSRGKNIFGHMVAKTIPKGEPCKKCTSCPYSESCNEYTASSGAIESEKEEETPEWGRGEGGDRQEEGEQISSRVSGNGE